MKTTEAAAVEHERRNGVIAVQVVDPKYDYVVVPSRRELFHAAFEPRAGSFEQDRPIVGSAPVKVGETVAVPSTQLTARPLLVRRQDADAEPRCFGQ